MNTQIEVGLSTTVCFSKRACWPSWPLRERFFEGTLRQSRQGIAAVAAVKIEAYDLSGRWPWISRRFYKSTFLLFEKAYAAP